MAESFLADFLLNISDRGRAILGRGISEMKSEPEDIIDQCETLLSGQGEATGLAMARDIQRQYAALDDAGRLRFFQALASDFGPDRVLAEEAFDAWHAQSTDDRAAELHFALEPRRQELFRRINRAPGGMESLVALRSDLLRILPARPELTSTDRDLHHLFSSWFNRGFLVLKRIDWSTPAIILDRIIRYEAVHEIRDWDDLRSRIEPSDRRCYGFFHPALPDEPLIFVEVALTREIADSIGPILAAGRQPLAAADANTAVFYSISNCQKGLKGVSFGNFLIKQVVDELARDLPGIKTFVTLSPAPTFMQWQRGLAEDDPDGILGDAGKAAVKDLENLDWYADPAVADRLRPILLGLAAHYYLSVKNSRGEPLDPVARFHLGNGARLERLNWLGDVSGKGISEGAGLMVNYRYELDDVERNHEAYANQREVIAADAVRRCLRTTVQSDRRAKA